MTAPIRCEDVMSRSPRCTKPNDSLLDAIEAMKEIDVGYIPVCEPTDNRLVGVLTDRDVAMALSKDVKPSQIRVSEVMSRDPVTVRPNEDVLTCAKAMEEHQFRRIPVVDDDNILQGIIATADILRKVGTRKEIVEELPALFSAISAPHHSG